MSRTIASFRRETARRLRSNSTFAETLLWRRARLVIEVDGSQHGSEAGRSRDTERTAWLKAEGYRGVRVWNSDVTRDIEAVMELIYAELHGALNMEPGTFRHTRRRNAARDDHPTPARKARRPSPSRGG